MYKRQAVVGEISSVSGDFNLVLQQGGVVSVKEDGELFATEVVCDVAEGEQRRRLQWGGWAELGPAISHSHSGNGGLLSSWS